MGVLPGGPELPEREVDALGSIPSSFDARDEWASCDYINEIRDQSACGSDWAFAAAEAITVRCCCYLHLASSVDPCELMLIDGRDRYSCLYVVIALM